MIQRRSVGIVAVLFVVLIGFGVAGVSAVDRAAPTRTLVPTASPAAPPPAEAPNANKDGEVQFGDLFTPAPVPMCFTGWCSSNTQCGPGGICCRPKGVACGHCC